MFPLPFCNTFEIKEGYVYGFRGSVVPPLVRKSGQCAASPAAPLFACSKGCFMTSTATNELPGFLPPLLAEGYPAKWVERIQQGYAGTRATSLRANTLKATCSEIASALSEAGIAWEAVPWYEDAFVLPAVEASSLWSLDIYKQGKVYLQSLSSMIPPLVADVGAGMDVLDMCAAPGGKTSQMAALAGGRCRITAAEMHAPRAEKLEYNLEKLGVRNATVMRTDARRLDSFFSFDRVLVDAPCSGSGTLRLSDPKMPKRFTPALVQKSTKAQKALLLKALEITKPQGLCVYSTCSVLPQENEQMVAACLKIASKRGSYKLEPVDLGPGMQDVPVMPNGLEGTLTVCPTNRYEGFFVAKIRRLA